MAPSATADGRLSTSSSAGTSSIFSIPQPVKRLFDTVPVVTYPANELPHTSRKVSRLPSLYVFSNDRDAAAGRPSFNPACLKWQTFLKIAGVEYQLVPSNNHASPSGSLPFLLPPSAQGAEVLPITTSKLPRYIEEKGKKVAQPADARYAAYQSLIDQKIRHAWLYFLYLNPSNFDAVARRLYISPISINVLVQKTVAHQLQEAAETELLKASSVIDPERLLREAGKAIEALSVMLEDDEWFFGSASPTLFDASLFAYTHLLLNPSMGWKDERLAELVRERRNLVNHCRRMESKYF